MDFSFGLPHNEQTSYWQSIPKGVNSPGPGVQLVVYLMNDLLNAWSYVHHDDPGMGSSEIFCYFVGKRVGSGWTGEWIDSTELFRGMFQTKEKTGEWIWRTQLEWDETKMDDEIYFYPIPTAEAAIEFRSQFANRLHQESLRSKLRKANQMRFEFRYDEALLLYNETIEKVDRSENREVHQALQMGLAHCHLHLGYFEKTEDLLDRMIAVELDGKLQLECLELKQRLAIELGQADKKSQLPPVEEAKEVRLTDRAREAYYNNQFELAIHYYQLLLEQEQAKIAAGPFQVSFYCARMASCYELKADYEKARQHINRAILYGKESNVDQSSLLFQKARLDAAVGDYISSNSIYEKILAQELPAAPTNLWMVYSQYAQSLSKQGLARKAEQMYEQGIERIEAERSRLNTDLNRVGFFELRSMAYANYTQHLIDHKLISKVLQVLEKMKARALMDLLTEQSNTLSFPKIKQLVQI